MTLLRWGWLSIIEVCEHGSAPIRVLEQVVDNEHISLFGNLH